MTRIYLTISLTFALFLVCNIGWIDPLADKTEKGNKLYSQSKFADAQKQYQSAQTIDPDSPQLYFNLADTLYKQEKYDAAEGLYKKALATNDKRLKAQANYNLGNVNVKKNKLKEALGLYRKAIKLDPADKDARINYEHVLRMIQEQQQQQQQQEQNKDQQDKDKEKDQQNKEQQQQDQQQDKEDQEQQKQKQQQDKEDQEQQNDQQNQQNQSQQDQPQEKQALTPEQLEELKQRMKPDENIDANPYLQALEKQEFDQRKQKKYGDSKLYIEKDW